MLPNSKIERFSSPEEELRFLRNEVERKEAALRGIGKEFTREQVISEEVKKYAKRDSNEVLAQSHALLPGQAEAIVLDLSPKSTDAKIEELLGILTGRGLHNALSVAIKLNDPQVLDDFHRFLVQYVGKHLSVPDAKRESSLLSALDMTLFEVTLPPSGREKEEPRSLKDVLSGMEQLYAGLLSIADEKNLRPVSLEVAVPENSPEIIFYAGVPNIHRELFEKQFAAIFPGGRLREEKNDYNIFKEHAQVAASVGVYARNSAFPLKTYEEFGNDPLSVLVGAFGKLRAVGEGAAFQVMFLPARGKNYVDRYRFALDQIKKGGSVSEALNMPETVWGDLGKGFKEFFSHPSGEDKPKEDLSEKRTIAEEALRKKTESPIVRVCLRALSSAESLERAEEILSGLEGSMNQFENTRGNSLSFKRIPASRVQSLVRKFSFRVWDNDDSLPISLKELVGVFHFPSTTKEKESSTLKRSEAAVAPAPTSMASGIKLGINEFQGSVSPVTLGAADRLRHFYVIGQTGTGKTNFIKNMIIQDIKNGEGVCFIDPHGSDIEEVLANIPENRVEDLIYFDPAYTKRSVGLNMLEYDPRFPEQKTFVVNELLSIFNKLFDMKISGGPAFEQYFRNSALLVMEHPESGSTLLEIARVMGDKAFRDLKLSHTDNPMIKAFWQNAERTSGEHSLANFIPYITNKFDAFLNNEYLRPVITQQKSAFNFREIMDRKKILLVNLSKGRLGELNANLLGLVLVGKILMAALSRVDSIGKDLPPFYLYIDEFQNITTDSIATILSEARKYKLSLTMAHQFIAQLEEKIRDAVFGNVGSVVAFRVGVDDAEYLEKKFSPIFTARDLTNLPNFHCYLSMLVSGLPARPFSLSVEKAEEGNRAAVSMLKEFSYNKLGVPRAEAEADIRERYKIGVSY